MSWSSNKLIKMCIWVTYLKLDLRESKMGWWKPLLCLQRNISIWLTLSRLWLQRDWGYSSNHTLYEHHVTHECPYWCLTLFVKASIHAQMAHGASALVSFSMKWLGVLLLPPGWDASPLQDYPQHFCCYLFVHLDKEKHCEGKVSCLRTQCNDPGQGLNPDHSILSWAH